MRRNGPSFRVRGGILGNLGSLLSGTVVVGLAFAFAGPFITVLAVIASIIYGAIITFRLLTPKRHRPDLKEWG